MPVPHDAAPRWVEVAPERLAGWWQRFAAEHGVAGLAATPTLVVLTGADGVVAEAHVPFPPMTVDEAAPDGGLTTHVTASRRFGLVLARTGAHAVGVVHGTSLVASKVGGRHVQGRTAAGGWSQQRYARRRAGQAAEALRAAADDVVRVLLPAADSLDAVVLGGDRRTVGGVLDDPRLAPLRPLLAPGVVDVPEPRLRVLQAAVGRARAVRIRITPPAGS